MDQHSSNAASSDTAKNTKAGSSHSPDLDKAEKAIDLAQSGATWDTMGRRGIWITNTRQADKLISKPYKEAPDKASLDRMALYAEPPVRKAKKNSLFAIVGSTVFLILLIILGYKCSNALAYRSHIDAGLQALSDGKFDAAQVEFSLAINADPESSDAYYYRALSEVNRGSHGNAFLDFKKARELNPKSAKIFLARASLLMKTHRYDLAIEDCDRVTSLDSNEATAYRIRACADDHLGKFDQAIADATQFLKRHEAKDADRGDALSKRAFAQDQKNNFARAIDDYSEAIACDPNNGTLRVARAIVYMQSKQWQKGLADCNAAIKLKPGDPVLYKVRGVCYAGLEMAKNSLSDLDHLVRLHPTVDTHRIRGEQRYVAGDLLGTLADFDYVLGAEPEDSSTHNKYLRAKKKLQQKAPRNIVVADEVRHANLPTVADLKKPAEELFRRGFALAQAGDDEPATEYLAAELRVKPRDVYARRLLAHVLERRRMFEDAISHFMVLAKQTTLDAGDKIAYAQALAGLGQNKNAVVLYKSVLSSEPKNDLARTGLIKSLIEIGSGMDAAQIAAEGAQRSPALHGTYKQLYDESLASVKKGTI